MEMQDVGLNGPRIMDAIGAIFLTDMFYEVRVAGIYRR